MTNKCPIRKVEVFKWRIVEEEELNLKSVWQKLYKMICLILVYLVRWPLIESMKEKDLSSRP